MSDPAEQDPATRFSLIIPAYNESESVATVIAEALAGFDARRIAPAEVVVVDDGSEDDTPKVLAQLAEGDARVRVITHEHNRGIGAANCTGFSAARGEWIGWAPADAQFKPDDVLDIYRKFPEADIIVTSVPPRERARADSLFRVILSKGLRWLMRLLLGSYTDMTGIFVMRRDAFTGMPTNMSTGMYNLVLPILIEKRGHRVEHCLIDIHPRVEGHSKVTNLRTVAMAFYELLRFRAFG